MEKRKPRKKLKKDPNFKDTFEVFDFSKIGTQDDPCFGKEYDVKAPECTRCGDSELCLIAQSQKNHVVREKLESKGSFKDLEEDLPKEKDSAVEIPRLVKKYVAKGYKFKKIERLIFKKFPEADVKFVKRLYQNNKP